MYAVTERRGQILQSLKVSANKNGQPVFNKLAVLIFSAV
jgi:hypothetical protein